MFQIQDNLYVAGGVKTGNLSRFYLRMQYRQTGTTTWTSYPLDDYLFTIQNDRDFLINYNLALPSMSTVGNGVTNLGTQSLITSGSWDFRTQVAYLRHEASNPLQFVTLATTLSLIIYKR